MSPSPAPTPRGSTNRGSSPSRPASIMTSPAPTTPPSPQSSKPLLRRIPTARPSAPCSCSPSTAPGARRTPSPPTATRAPARRARPRARPGAQGTRAADPSPGRGSLSTVGTPCTDAAAGRVGSGDAADRPRPRGRGRPRALSPGGHTPRDADRARRHRQDTARARRDGLTRARSVRRPLGRDGRTTRPVDHRACPGHRRDAGAGRARDSGHGARGEAWRPRARQLRAGARRGPRRCASRCRGTRDSDRRPPVARRYGSAPSGRTRCHRSPLPSLDATAVETIERAAATRLYVERACAADPSFALTDANAHGGRPHLSCASTGSRSRSSWLPHASDRSGPRGRPPASTTCSPCSPAAPGTRPERQRSPPGHDQLERPAARRALRGLCSASWVRSAAAPRSTPSRRSRRPGCDVPTAVDDLLDAALVGRHRRAGRRAARDDARDHARVRHSAALRVRLGDGLSAIGISAGLLHSAEGDDVYWRRSSDASLARPDRGRSRQLSLRARACARCRRRRAGDTPGECAPLLLARPGLRRGGPAPARGGAGAERRGSRPRSGRARSARQA